jgi:putative spermidine/putrescine transport system ATP-binding protein
VDSFIRDHAVDQPAVRAQRLELKSVSKSFGEVQAVDDVSLTVEAGEFMTLLGPSGSGKSTVLMLIAGFELPTAGKISIGNRAIGHVPPYRRNIGVVFQQYGLFPHMTVEENLAFPLKSRGHAQKTIGKKIGDALRRVQLTGYDDRYPHELSGGQQQRVAVARAIVFDPPLLLMDEPLSALDKKLREQMQVELKHLQRELGITVVAVTHDQSEALTMSDRVALMNHGKIIQVGKPDELYNAPVNRFVADFIGDANLLELRATRRIGGVTEAETMSGLKVTLPISAEPGAALTVILRPERIFLVDDHENRAPDGILWKSAVIQDVVFIGEACKYRLKLAGESLLAKQQLSGRAVRFAAGDVVNVGWLTTDLRIVS